MTEQGTDSYGAEYERTSNDFHFRLLEQDNCICSICHGTGAKIEFRYVTRNYESARQRGKICKNLQAHGHSFWICPICLYRLDSKANGIKEYVKNFLERERKMSDIKTMPLICLRCKKYIPLSMPTFKEVSYTHYSYCEECLRKGLKALKAWDELYKQIYDHHYEIIKSEPSESRNAKLSLSNWILDIMTGYDFEPQESEDKE